MYGLEGTGPDAGLSETELPVDDLSMEVSVALCYLGVPESSGDSLAQSLLVLDSDKQALMFPFLKAASNAYIDGEEVLGVLQDNLEGLIGALEEHGATLDENTVIGFWNHFMEYDGEVDE